MLFENMAGGQREWLLMAGINHGNKRYLKESWRYEMLALNRGPINRGYTVCVCVCARAHAYTHIEGLKYCV